MSFWSDVSADAWVQVFSTVLGAFIGTLLAGVISVWLYTKEQRDRMKVETKGFKRNFILYYTPRIKAALQLAKEVDLRDNDFSKNERRYYALNEVINEAKRYYLRELEPLTLIERHELFEDIYMNLVNIQTFSRYTTNEANYTLYAEIMGIDKIMTQSIERIEARMKEITEEVHND
ncbi:hypothetical protein [Alteribacillus sp. HJP-4]|uniref:hypothetical protein n=1 Tax=Alteribacillus sp. HJP-4 TaxID=2775394 RepID=UPI0035CD3148